MKKLVSLAILIAASTPIFSQTNVRAWYAQGQVWVIWQITAPVPETVGVYKKSTAFGNTSEAALIGRPFQYEYLPGTYIQQTGDTSFTYRVPKPDGSYYQLAKGEGLFVETVTNSGSAFYAVVEWGKTAVVPGVNITQNTVQFNYNPQAQPVNCHFQRSETLVGGFKTFWFSMWALGRQDENAGRPDFPVMANAAKNGMPSMFIVSQALTLDTSGGQKVPLTHWFHGGGMVASQFMANRAKHINIEPKQGVSVSHNDDFGLKTISETGDTAFTSGRSLWFGWSKRHDPFDQNFNAGPGDTIINYTQRRVLWINDWLIGHFPIDPQRVALQGYSMGSAGASALGKAFPERFSTVCAFNNGYRSGTDPTSEAMVGSIAENLPTNLRRSPNDVVRINEVFDLATRISPSRDFPIFRTWAGKRDENDRMFWSPDLVAQYRRADSLGTGAQISWDERMHTYPVLNMHWIQGEAASQQTGLDDLAFQENYRSDQSYPAFFNHRLDPRNNDPGSGQIGINNGDGDDWGTWGGYHRWENTLEDAALGWQTTAWLESNAVFGNDNCPENSLKADLAIRKPQKFKPPTGKNLKWAVKDWASGQVLQNGQTVVQADNLVVVPQVEVFRESVRKVLIQIFDPTISTGEADVFSGLQIFPNPVGDFLYLKNGFSGARIFDLNGRLILEKSNSGESKLDVAGLPGGVYFLEIFTEQKVRQVGRFVKI